jgi:hypothetical protein
MYYEEIAQDSPGFKPGFLPKYHPLRIAAEGNSNSFNSTDSNSNSACSAERNSRSVDPDPLLVYTG